MHDRNLRPSPAVRASSSTDGLVLLDLDGGVVWSSNEVGARIWQLLEERHSAPEIVARLVSEYDAPRERIERDVRAFLAALASRELLVRGEQP